MPVSHLQRVGITHVLWESPSHYPAARVLAEASDTNKCAAGIGGKVVPILKQRCHRIGCKPVVRVGDEYVLAQGGLDTTVQREVFAGVLLVDIPDRKLFSLLPLLDY
jgi:hypothetical protein